MPKSTPPREQSLQTPPASHETSAFTTGSGQDRDSRRRADHVHQPVPTLPPVASLAGYISSIPPSPAVTEAGSPATVRTFGMQSILNPATDFEPPRPAQRISQSPGRRISAAYSSQHTPVLSPRIRKRGEDGSPGMAIQAAPEQRQGRRMLTPKSPALRALSQAVGRSPSSVHLSGRPAGPGEPRVYSIDPGDAAGGLVPPLPPINRSLTGPFTPSLPPQDPSMSAATASHSNSTTSYSANTQGHMGSPSSSSNFADREETSPFPTAAHESRVHPNTSTTRMYGSNQPSYQMQLATDQGPMIVPVEVDIQQASKLADEKRKRNAGASARFRQRRKEKEQAAAATIAELQRQMREITEERDFYLGERNALRDFITRTPGVQLPPRPPSPHLRRAQPSAQFGGGQGDGSSNLEYGRRDIGEPSPAQRRRTTEYQPAFAPPLAPANYPHQFHQPPPASYSLPPPSLSAPLADPRSGPPNAPPGGPQSSHMSATHPPPQPLSAGMRPQVYDPFRRDPNTH